MTRLREEFDADFEHPRFDELGSLTKVREVICSQCGRSLFCDQHDFDRTMRAFEADVDNQFICDRCIEQNESVDH